MADPSADNLKIYNDGVEIAENPRALDFSSDFAVEQDGDVTAIVIAEEAIESGQIANGAVRSQQLSEELQPSHVVKFAGLTASETDGDASVVASVAGVLATDIVIATILAQAGTATILKAVPTTDTITFTLSGNGGAGTRIQYAVLRTTLT